MLAAYLYMIHAKQKEKNEQMTVHIKRDNCWNVSAKIQQLAPLDHNTTMTSLSIGDIVETGTMTRLGRMT